MSGASEFPESGIDEGKSPKTPKGRKLVQGRLPFTAVDNKNSVSQAQKEKSKLSVDKESNSVNNSVVEDEKEVYVVEIDNMSKSNSMPDDDDMSSSTQEISLVEDDQNSEMDCSILSTEREKLTPSAKGSTPRHSEREKRRLERLKEREEKEKKKAEEKAEKERLRKEKEEEKKKKEEEKEAEKKRKEEERKKKEEEKEAEKRKKEEEKKKKEEEKEAERKRKEEEKEAEKKKKEEEKKKREEEKELEKKKKEDEERRKKERLSQVFTNFFTQKKGTSTKEEKPLQENASLAFPPFQIKENMKLAPILRTEFDSVRQEILDDTLRKSSQSYKLDKFQFKKIPGRKCGPTWPLNKDNDVEVIDEDEAPSNKENIVTLVPALPRRMRPKLLKFTENRRPAYWGTWGKTSHSVGPRRPFGKEAIFDYDVDSDDEWEEEVEPGESLTDSEDENEEKEPADDYEVDNEFLVPHGYLSDEEGEKDEDERPLSPSAAKEQLKLKEEQFKKELKEKTCHIKPSLIGCCWLDDVNNEPQLIKVLQRYATVVLSTNRPIRLNSIELANENGESPIIDDPTRSEKASKRIVNENDIPSLIKLLHGSLCSKVAAVKEFQLYLERNRTEETKSGPSKLQIMTKIAEIASWSKCNEAGAMNGRTCWLVHPEVLERYGLAEISVINTWEFATETKKRGRKADDSKAEEDTPPAKTPRVSLTKKFAQSVSTPPSGSTPSESTSADEVKNNATPEVGKLSMTTPKAKKRITLISLPTSSTKKPKSDLKSTPLTNFLKKMSNKAAPSKSSDDAEGSSEMEGIECLADE